jgi:hypothetical protein
MINNFIENELKKEDDFFRTHLIQNALPKIKGDLTQGKLKWRGIKMIVRQEGLNSIKWIEQRGVKISPEYKISLYLQ